jgi:O-antigen/teichoic acid export membrane protein
MSDSNKYNILNRLSVSFGFNILRSLASFLTVILLARWLGPQEYGIMVFLLASFVAYQALVDMASTSAFFTFLSQRTRSKKFIIFYWRWIVIQFFVSFGIIYLILPDSLVTTIWHGESRNLIILAFVATFMQQTVWTIVSQMAEANRESIKIQKISVIFTTGHFFIIFLLWKFGILLLPLIFIALFFEWGLASLVASKLYYKNRFDKENIDSHSDTAASVFREFWIYCWPFIPMVGFTFFHNISSVWMLQEWGGAEEQAYHGIGLQFAAIPMIFTASVLKIFWKEIAEAKHLGDMQKLEYLYYRATRSLFFIGAIFAGLLSPWSREIILLFLGNEYLAGIIPLMLMLIYPVHQSFGQLASAMLFATENTKIQVILGMIFATVGILVTFILLSPQAGFQLAAIGLALKLIVVQILEVNTKSFVISRIFKWKFDWAFQIFALGFCLIFGWICKLMFSYIIDGNIYITFLLSSIVYIILILLFLYIYPLITGFNINQLNNGIKNIINKID